MSMLVWLESLFSVPLCLGLHLKHAGIFCLPEVRPEVQSVTSLKEAYNTTLQIAHERSVNPVKILEPLHTVTRGTKILSLNRAHHCSIQKMQPEIQLATKPWTDGNHNWFRLPAQEPHPAPSIYMTPLKTEYISISILVPSPPEMQPADCRFRGLWRVNVDVNVNVERWTELRTRRVRWTELRITLRTPAEPWRC
jgi:hypothetical protein